MRSNQKGYSLVEVLVAAGIVGIIAVSTMSAFPYLRQMNNRLRGGGSCRAYLDASFARLEQLGFRAQVPNTSVVPTTTALVPLGAGVYNIPPTALYPTAAAALPLIHFINSDNFTQLRTPGLIMSSATLINALYRTQSTICGSTYDIDGSAITSSHFLPVPSDDIKNALKVKMNVQPFDLNQRKVVGCGTTGFDATSVGIPAPKGLKIGAIGSGANESAIARMEAERSGTIGNADASFQYPIARHEMVGPTDTITPGSSVAESRNNLGFAVKLSVNFTITNPSDTSHETDKAQSCEETRVISLSADLTPPVLAGPPPLASVNRPPYGISIMGPTSVDLYFKYGPGGEPATVLMCRDYSQKIAGVVGRESSGKIYYTQDPAHPILMADKIKKRWVPCEKVTACGIKPSSAPTIVGDQTSYMITNRYTGLPYGCRIRIEIAAVDSAGNISTPRVDYDVALTDN